MYTLGGKPVPKALLDIVVRVRDRVKDLKKTYGSLAKYGLPYLESVEEIAVIYYLNVFMDIGLNELSNFIGVDKTSLYKLKQRIDESGEVSYYDRSIGKTVKVKLTRDDVEKIVSELIQPTSKRDIKDLFESSVVQEFLKNPVRITKSGKYTTYSQTQIKDVLRMLSRIIEYIKKKGIDIPSNPDHWTKEHEAKLAEVIYSICKEKYGGDEVKVRRCRYDSMTKIRRIQRFYDMKMFEGMVGAVTKTIKPVIEKETIEDYETYLKLKKIYIDPPKNWSEKDVRDYRAWFEIARLHILIGCREGYGSIYLEADRMKSIGINNINGFNLDKVLSMDLDDIAVVLGTSLLGLKWEDISFNPFAVRIYERKTDEVWYLTYNWLDDDIPNMLINIKKSTENIVKHSVVKSILMYYNIDIKTSVRNFAEWYRSRTKEYGKLVELKNLTPHRLRSAHISLLAYLGVPLEISVSKQSGLGVGWSDLATAVHFYWKLSQKRVQQYIQNAIEFRKQIKI
ncbi:MAG: hypothetical protein QXX52_08160 [Ignisphaera sp.]